MRRANPAAWASAPARARRPAATDPDSIVQDHIRLDQLLKLEGLVQTGGHAKMLIQSGDVRVDGQVETRRGRKLFGGETVEVDGRKVVVTAEEG